MNPAEWFDGLVEQMSGRPDVSVGTGFGSHPGLRFRGRIYAMLLDQQPVVKLPAYRCQQLVAAGEATAFTRGQGRPLQEWVCLEPPARPRWSALVEEAYDYVGAGGTS